MPALEFLSQNNINAKISEDTFGCEILSVDRVDIYKTIEILKIGKDASYNMLTSVTAVDTTENFELIYNLYSTYFAKKIMVKTVLDRLNPQVDSVCGLFSSANWHERECYDLMGINFSNHPDLKRILMPKDWIGHPLRKDYENTDERLSWNNR